MTFFPDSKCLSFYELPVNKKSFEKSEGTREKDFAVVYFRLPNENIGSFSSFQNFLL